MELGVNVMKLNSLSVTVGINKPAILVSSGIVFPASLMHPSNAGSPKCTVSLRLYFQMLD